MDLKKISIEGINLFTDNEKIARELYDETFDSKEFESLKKDYHYFDCGAHIGIHLLKLKNKFPEIEVTCFEPDPKNFKILEKNSKSLKNVKLVNAAISNNNGSTMFYINGEDTRGNSITSQWSQRPTTTREIIVKTVTLSDYINKRSWIKLDIEGGELDVFKNLEKNKKFDLIEGFHLEVHTTNKDKINKYESIKSILIGNHFKILVDEEKEFEYMLPKELISWKKNMESRIYTIVAIKK